MAHAGSSSSCGCSGSNNSMLKIQVAGAQAANDKIVAAQIEKDRLYRVECEAALDWLRNERVALDGVPRQRTPSQLQWAAATAAAATAAAARTLAGNGAGKPPAVGTDPGSAAEIVGAKPKSGAPTPPAP